MNTRSLILFASLALGCADDSGAITPNVGIRCESPKGRATMIIARFGFVRADTMRPTISDGLDIDGHTSVGGGVTGCGRADFTAPDGRTGIDNQLARLLPVVDQMTGGALDGLIQGTINNGQLLVALTIEGLENRCDDADVSLMVQRVSAMPFVGSDMLLDPGQTFDLQRTEPVTRLRGRISGGVLTTQPGLIPLPVAVLNERFILNLYDARMQLRLDDQGGASGILGGGISVREFTAISSRFDVPDALRMAIATTMRLTADLAPDASGVCQNLSAAVAVVARHAFVNP